MYDFLRDQGSILAGLLALFAGWLAYRAGIKQAQVARQQTKEVREEARRNAATRSLIACRLLQGALSRVKDEIERVVNLLMQPTYQNGSTAIPSSWKELITMPPLETVWTDLGQFLPDTIGTYMRLDAQIRVFRTDGVLGAGVTRDRLRGFLAQATFLLDEIAALAMRANKTLVELSEKPPKRTLWQRITEAL